MVSHHLPNTTNYYPSSSFFQHTILTDLGTSMDNCTLQTPTWKGQFVDTLLPLLSTKGGPLGVSFFCSPVTATCHYCIPLSTQPMGCCVGVRVAYALFQTRHTRVTPGSWRIRQPSSILFVYSVFIMTRRHFCRPYVHQYTITTGATSTSIPPGRL